MSCQARAQPRAGRRDGVALMSLLVTVVVLGVLGAYVISMQSGAPGPKQHSPGSASTTAATTVTAIRQSGVAACIGDFAAVRTAIDDYRTLNGSNPPAGESWATSTAHGGPFLQSWPTPPNGRIITWDGATLGVAGRTGTTSHGSAGNANSSSGCYSR